MMFWFNLAFAATSGDLCADSAGVEARSAAIKAIYDEGQAEAADRTSGAASVLKRDEQRVKKILGYDSRGELCTAQDKWYAAWILVQADSVERIERAYELAVETMEAHHANGPWLVAFTFDLKRTREGFHQAYGTQTRVNERNQRCLIFVEPDVTDEDRAKYGVRPIVQTYDDILDRNGFGADSPTLESVERRGLYCEPNATRERDDKRIGAPGAE